MVVNKAVVGLQWGDEGKAKILDEIVEQTRQDNDEKIWVVRSQGGPNAGHTMYVRVPDQETPVEFITHAAPSGIASNTEVGIGPHTAFDTEKFMNEWKEAVSKFGYDAGIHISERVGILMDYHRLIDAIQEGKRKNPIGTTKSGIGPFYMDNANRATRITFADYIGDKFHDKLKDVLEAKENILESGGINIDQYAQELIALHDPIRKELAPFACRLEYRLNEALRNGNNILIEGAQGTGLDNDYGTIPDQTSSHLLGPQLIASLGLPRRDFEIVGIQKVYPTRVGNGPMPTLDHGSFGKETQEFSGEEGATTGRIRDVGFPDWVYARFSSMINDVDEIILTRGDCVQNVEIKVCTAYDVNGEIIEEVPLNLNGVKPVYSDKSYEWHLWDGPRDLSDAQKVDKILRPKRMEYVKAGGAGIPAGLREYVKDFEKFVRRPVSYISIGPTRGESIKL